MISQLKISQSVNSEAIEHLASPSLRFWVEQKSSWYQSGAEIMVGCSPSSRSTYVSDSSPTPPLCLLQVRLAASPPALWVSAAWAAPRSPPPHQPCGPASTAPSWTSRARSTVRCAACLAARGWSRPHLPSHAQRSRWHHRCNTLDPPTTPRPPPRPCFLAGCCDVFVLGFFLFFERRSQ